MRSIVFAVALMVAAVPVAQAQQAQLMAPTSDITTQSQQALVPVAAQAPDLRPVDAPIGFARSNAATETIESNRVAEERAAFRDPSARSILAIIGAIVVIVAVIALLN